MFLLLFLKLNSGFIKFMLEIYILFQELLISNTGKIKTVPYYKAAVPGSNPAIASISKLAA
jgi:hypothetical protein